MSYRELIDSEGGFTFNPINHTIPKSGYIVSLDSSFTRQYRLDTFGDDAVADYLTAPFVRSWLENKNFYIGGWVHEGFVWLDISEQFDDLEIASDVGARRNQIAIWDVVNACEIFTGGTGD